MTIAEFMSDHLDQIVVEVFLAAASALFLFSAGTGSGVVILLGIFWILFLFFTKAAEFIRCRARLQELQAVMDGLDKKYLFAECVSRGRSVYERRLLELSRKAGRAMIREVSDAAEAQREYREYVENWVHEMKAPITAAGLICRKVEPENRRKLSGELAQIEAHVERALFYARAESREKDFIIRQEDLGSIVAAAVSRHKTLLILSGVRVETLDLEQTVYTDGKWAAFIIGQLLQNAVRYRRKEEGVSVITLSAERIGKQIRFVAADNGIGIPAHELPRVFDRGFTGSNGRIRGGSTGMGLYLCKKLADSLEMDLRVLSEEGRGTTVLITFPARVWEETLQKCKEKQ